MVKFIGFECRALLQEYANDNTAIQLWSDEEGVIATATLNLGEKLPKDQAYIKDYFENAGMLQALIDAGIITEVLSVREQGYASIPLCKLDLERI